MQKVNVSINGLGKAAFVVGFGLTVGKTVGRLVSGAINGGTLGVIKGMAACGNKAAQEACDNNSVKYDTKNEQDESDVENL